MVWLLLSSEDYFTRRLLEESFSYTYTYDSSGVYGGYDYFGTYDTVRVYSLDEFFGINLLRYLKRTTVSAYDTSSSQAISGLVPDIEIPVHIPRRWRFLGEGVSKVTLRGEQTISIGGFKEDLLSPGGQNLNNTYQMSNVPGINMKQTLNVTITGQITDRLKVEVRHNSEATDVNRQKILLSYTGTDDDIVQSLQAGDIDVSDFPSTTYSSLGAGAGLFGLKGRFALGPARIVAVATKEKGQSQTKVFQAQSQIITDTIWGSDYLKETFFYLPITPFIPPGDNPNDYYIADLLLFYRPQTLTGNTYVYGKAYHMMDTLGIITDDTTRCFVDGRFVQMDPASYRFYSKNVVQLLEQPDASLWWLGAVYNIVKNDGTDTIQVGYVPPSPDSTNPIRMLLMKLDKMASSDTSLTCARNINLLELKNIYTLPYELDTSVAPTDITFNIYRDNPTANDSIGQNGIKFSTLLGVDPDGDGHINDIVTVINGSDTVNFRVLDVRPEGGGYLIFPRFWPFADTILNDRDSVIYLLDREYWRNYYSEKYYMVLTFKKPQAFISLGGSVLNGSVEIFRNGQKLEEGRDYRVDYSMGTVHFMIPLNETDEIRINYRSAYSFQSQSRAILGLASTFDISENFKVNLNYMSKSVASTQRRPDFGSEPNSYGVLDASVKFNHTMDYLNRFLNAHTPLSLEKKSEVQVDGEVARSFPNPNTVGETYLDKFDQINDNLTNLVIYDYRGWIHGSLPYILDSTTHADTAVLANRQSWYSGYMAVRGDILPVDDPNDRTKREQLLRLVAEPRIPGIPNFMTIMMGERTERSYQDMEYVEVYVRGSGVLIFDIGTNIPEDAYVRACDGNFYGLGVLNTEDLDGDNQFTETREDVGLDGVPGEDAGCNPSGGDWGNDDYTITDPTKADPFDINRYEGNHNMETEDLNRNFQLDMSENFYSYIIDIDTMTPLAEYNGWKLFRIPLRRPTRVYGNPSLDRIAYYRLTWYGFTRTDTLFLWHLGIGGSAWINEGPKVDTADTSQYLAMNFVSRKTTPGYVSPPGVEEKLNYEAGSTTLEDEGAMSMLYEIKPGDYVLSRKRIGNKYNFVNYRSISLWVWDRTASRPTLVIRFGKDSLNFYEFRQRITGDGWLNVKVPLDSLVLFKGKDYSPDYRSNGRYGVRGNPSIFEVEFFWIGIANDSPDRISGELWVNELRLTDPVRVSAHAGNVTLRFNVSDLFQTSVNGNFEQVDFARSATDLSQYRSARFNFNTTFNVHSLFPKAWGINLPLNVSYNFSNRRPKFYPGLDVPVTSEEERRRLTSTSKSTAYNVSFSKTGSTGRLGKWFIDPWRLTHGMRSDFSYIPGQSKDSTVSENYGIRYSYRPTGEFMWKERRYRFLPSSYSISYDYNRTSSFTEVLGSRTRRTDRTGNLSGSINYDPIPGILSFGYSASRRGDYRYPELFRTSIDSILGFESQFRENVTASLNLGSIWFLRPSVNYRHGYSENRKPENALTGFDVRDLNEDLSVGFTLNLETGTLLSKAANLRDKSKDTALSKAGPMHTILYGMDRLSRVWRNVRFNYSFSRTSNYYAALGRASWAYRFGISLNPEVVVTDTQRSLWRETHNYDLSTDINVGNYRVSPRGSYRRDLSDDQTRRILTETWRFPDVTLNGRPLPIISNFKFVASSDFTVSYSDERGYTSYPLWEPTIGDTVEPRTVRRTRTFNFSPHAILKNGTNLNFTYTYTVTTNRQVYSATDLETRSYQTNYDFTVSHTFSGFAGIRFPWSKNRLLSLKNQLTLSLKYTTMRGTDITINYLFEEFGNYIDTLSRRKSDNMTLSATYQFSNAVEATFSYIYDLSGDYEGGVFTRKNQIRADIRIKF